MRKEFMDRTLNICKKEINIFGNTELEQPCPVVYLNTVMGEGQKVYDLCKKITGAPFIMVAISKIEWDHDMSPWAIPPISKNDTPCTGGADTYLHILTEKIIPEVEGELDFVPTVRILAGYSLAGLFAIYSLYQTDCFHRIASVSGSFWFPEFVEYIGAHILKEIPEKIYFSLGDKESRTQNPFLKTVGERTQKVITHLSNQGITTTFEENKGNHFREANERMAKGIVWCLK